MAELPKGDDLRALIDQYKNQPHTEVEEYVNSLIDSAKATDDGMVDAPNPQAAVYLGEQLTLVKAQITELEKVEAQFSDALKNIAGDGVGIRAGDVVIATIAHITPKPRVNAAMVEELFPFEDYPGLYLDQKPQVRLNLNKDFKASALSEQREVSG